jgi:uncharacterized protein (TIGR02271 family)
MPLYKIADFYHNYRDEIFEGNDIKGLGIYTETNQKVGTVSDILVDQDGRFRYLVIDTGFWIFGKQVLLPSGLFRSDPRQQRIFLRGLSKQQAEDLPEYHETMTVDADYEERVRQVYRMTPLEASAPLEAASPLPAARPLGDRNYRQDTPLEPIHAPAPVEPHPATPLRSEPRQEVPPSVPTPVPVNIPQPINPVPVAADPASARTTPDYRYDQEASLYTLNEQDHATFKLYEERLVATKHREKRGEVVVGKRVEMQTARIVVPLEKERVIVRRYNTGLQGKVVPIGAGAFQSREVARFEIYEEMADIQKQPVVREEVRIHKQVDRGTVEAEGQIRREALDVTTAGDPAVDAPVDRSLHRRGQI